MRQGMLLTRRSVTGGLAAAAVIALGGCSRSPGEQQQAAKRQPSSSPPQLAAMTVYRDPSCGCCQAWAAIARTAGYQVTVIDRTDMPAIKLRYGVPKELESCHTTTVGNYAVEGHVPLELVGKLLVEKPADVRGIAVPGMPAGSPGMEVPDGTKQPFQVMAFDSAGRISPFRA